MNIWNSYIWTAEWRNKCKEDPRSYYRNLCSCEKKAWKKKKSGLPGFEPWPLRYRCSALTNWANKPTGSWSLNWFVIYPGKMKMKLWIYETHIFSSNIWVSYIHNFIFIFPGYITNQFNDQLPVGLLAQLVRALHRYRRGQGSNPGKPDFFFFQAFFSQLHKLR